jgi:hypothetical protein
MSYENPVLEKGVGGIHIEDFKRIFKERKEDDAVWFAENFGPAAYDSV